MTADPAPPLCPRVPMGEGLSATRVVAILRAAWDDAPTEQAP